MIISINYSFSSRINLYHIVIETESYFFILIIMNIKKNKKTNRVSREYLANKCDLNYFSF